MIEKMQVYNGFVMCWVLFYLPLFLCSGLSFLGKMTFIQDTSGTQFFWKSTFTSTNKNNITKKVMK